MRDLKSGSAIWAKGILFLVIGVTASVLLLLELHTLRGGVLLILSIWAFCRAYYFAFYVLEKYVDPSFRFSGLLAFACHLLRRDRNG